MSDETPPAGVLEKMQRAVAQSCDVCTVSTRSGSIARAFSVRHGEYEVCRATFEFVEDVEDSILAEVVARHMAVSH